MRWLFCAFAAGLLGAVIAAAWLLYLGAAFGSDAVALLTSASVGLLPPLALVFAARNRSFDDRVRGAALGVLGFCLGVVALGLYVETLHHPH